MFTQENTEGYTEEELSTLNDELQERLEGLEPFTDEYDIAEKAFTDEVSKR
jgi:hypothetical protein